MTSLNRELVAQTRKRFCDAGQGHVFTWWDEISGDEREGLFRQLMNIDLDLIHRLVAENLKEKPGKEERHLEPIAIIPLPSTPEEKEYRESAREEGESILREGRCAAFMMAGSMDRHVKAFVKRHTDQKHMIVLTTSGDGGWLPDMEGHHFDAISSASQKDKIDEVADQIIAKMRSLLDKE